MCCFVEINQHHLSFSLHPTSHRFCDRNRWIIQKSNKYLFAGSPHLTFLPGKLLSHKPLVIPAVTSGWSTAVSTVRTAVVCSGTHTAHNNNQFLNDVGWSGNYSPAQEVRSFDWNPCLSCPSGITWGLFELMKCSTVLTTPAMSVSTHLVMRVMYFEERTSLLCSWTERGHVSHVDSQVQNIFHKHSPVQTSNNSKKR